MKDQQNATINDRSQPSTITEIPIPFFSVSTKAVSPYQPFHSSRIRNLIIETRYNRSSSTSSPPSPKAQMSQPIQNHHLREAVATKH